MKSANKNLNLTVLMMVDVLIFSPKHKFDVQQNYDDFIMFAKNDLTMFSDCEFREKKGWECDKWTIETSGTRKIHLLFGICEDSMNFTPYQQPYADFARAYVRFYFSVNRLNSKAIVYALQWLYRALVEKAEENKKTEIDVMDINNNVINRAEELIRNSELSEQTRYGYGGSLEQLINFIREKRLKLGIQIWKNPFKKRVRHNSLEASVRKVQMDKCPSDYQMLQVAEAFRKAATVRQKYFTSLCVMLMCQPARVVELNGLTTYSLQKTGTNRWYLMWHPSKGGEPIRKWVPKPLEEVVGEAFKRLIEISAPARAAAKFAYNYPDRFMPHDGCITRPDFPRDKPLTFDQFAAAMGLRIGPARRNEKRGWRWANSEWINDLLSNLNNTQNWRTLIPEGCKLDHDNKILQKVHNVSTGKVEFIETEIIINFPTFNDLIHIVNQRYKTTNFPYYGDVPLWDCICLVRDSEFNKKLPVKPFSWLPFKPESLACAIGAEVDGSASVFEELGITDEDGTRLKLTSHQFRHWLNTKLMLAGEADWLIAKWSGRADIKQNRAYDGRTPEQRSHLTKRIGSGENNENMLTVTQIDQELALYTSESPPPSTVLHDLALPVSLKSLGVKRNGVAQFTGLGYCIHNYSDSPCIKNGDCATCNEHICLKGIPHTINELKSLVKLHEEQLTHARASDEDNVFGADRWVTSLGFKLSKLRTLIVLLEDSKTADGTPVRVPDELSPSPVKRSLNVEKKDVNSGLDLITLAISKLAE